MLLFLGCCGAFNVLRPSYCPSLFHFFHSGRQRLLLFRNLFLNILNRLFLFSYCLFSLRFRNLRSRRNRFLRHFGLLWLCCCNRRWLSLVSTLKHSFIALELFFLLLFLLLLQRLLLSPRFGLCLWLIS